MRRRPLLRLIAATLLLLAAVTGTLAALVRYEPEFYRANAVPDVIALELCGFSAGALPLGTHTLLEFVSEKVEDLKLNIKVSPYRYDGHPVLLLYYQHDQPRPTLRIQRLECLPGQFAFTARN